MFNLFLSSALWWYFISSPNKPSHREKIVRHTFLPSSSDVFPYTKDHVNSIITKVWLTKERIGDDRRSRSILHNNITRRRQRWKDTQQTAAVAFNALCFVRKSIVMFCKKKPPGAIRLLLTVRYYYYNLKWSLPPPRNPIPIQSSFFGNRHETLQRKTNHVNCPITTITPNTDKAKPTAHLSQIQCDSDLLKLPALA